MERHFQIGACRRFQLRARSALLGRSDRPLEPELRWDARARLASLGRSKFGGPDRFGIPGVLEWAARSPFDYVAEVGLAGARELASRGRSAELDARALSASLGRSTTQK